MDKKENQERPLATSLLAAHIETIQVLKSQIQIKENRLKVVQEENKIYLELVQEKYHKIIKKLEEELQQKDNRIIEIQKAHHLQIKDIERLLKEQAFKSEQLKDIQIKHLKDLNKNLQEQLIQKQLHQRRLQIKVGESENSIIELNRKIIKNKNKNCILIVLLIISGIILFLFYRDSMLMDFELYKMDLALKFQDISCKQKLTQREKLYQQQKKYLEDKSNGCCIM